MDIEAFRGRQRIVLFTPDRIIDGRVTGLRRNVSRMFAGCHGSLVCLDFIQEFLPAASPGFRSCFLRCSSSDITSRLDRHVVLSSIASLSLLSSRTVSYIERHCDICYSCNMYSFCQNIHRYLISHCPVCQAPLSNADSRRKLNG